MAGLGPSGLTWTVKERSREKSPVNMLLSLIRVVSHQSGLSSGLAHQGGLLLRWPSIGMISHLGGLSGWAHQEDLSLGGLPFGWSLIIVVFQ